MAVIIVVVIAIIAAEFEWRNSSTFIGSLAFASPPPFRAPRPSNELFLSTATAVCLRAIAAGFWGLNRIVALKPWVAAALRGL